MTTKWVAITGQSNADPSWIPAPPDDPRPANGIIYHNAHTGAPLCWAGPNVGWGHNDPNGWRAEFGAAIAAHPGIDQCANLWAHGEAECLYNNIWSDNYDVEMVRLIDEIDTAAGHTKLVWFIELLNLHCRVAHTDTPWQSVQEIRALQQAVAAQRPGRVVILNNDDLTLGPDNLHYQYPERVIRWQRFLEAAGAQFSDPSWYGDGSNGASLNVTLAPTTLSSSASVPISASLAVTLAPTTLASSVSVPPPDTFQHVIEGTGVTRRYGVSGGVLEVL